MFAKGKMVLTPLLGYNLMLITTTSAAEYKVHEHQYLISRTDLNSCITYVNDTFSEVSGYTGAELLGATNGMFRHPDMPDAVFDDIWVTLKANRIWSGIMKHRRKDGGFFWVLATISPLVVAGRTVGYTTVRTQPHPAHLRRASEVYSQLKRGRLPGVKLSDGKICRTGLAGWLKRVTRPTIRARLTRMIILSMIGLVCVGVLPYFGKDAAYLSAMLFAVLLMTSWRLHRSILAPLSTANDLCRKLSAGDLSEKIDAKFDDEIGWLIGSLNTMQKSFASVVLQVFSGTSSVEVSAQEINAGNMDLSHQTEQQAAALQETAAAMEQLTSTVKQNANSAEQASQLAVKTSNIATRGGEDVQQVVDKIHSIASGNKKIENFINVIDGVAFQTNVLALNAAVEAARAGPEGRGFAVVAAEVRSLAQRSAAASREIKELIKNSVKEVADAAQLSVRAAQTTGEIVHAVKMVSDLMSQIATASMEQSGGIEQITLAVAHMDQATQRNAHFVEQLAATAASLEKQSSALKNSVAVFHLSDARK